MKEFNEILNQARSILKNNLDSNAKLKEICALLKGQVPHYHWVGFYIADEPKKELVLGPFAGEPTVHTRINFGQGICGQAAERRRMFLVPDITKETNYLACSPKVKSEIVIPVFKRNKIVGELDIDSHVISAFTAEDKKFLEGISKMVAELF